MESQVDDSIAISVKLLTHQGEAEVYTVAITEVNKLVYVCWHEIRLAVIKPSQ